MCGIYGLVDRRHRVDQAHLARQRDLLAHRGPDDAGLWTSTDGSVGLAHRRLSIIDLTPAGHQPMASADGKLVIVFNGEIYNFLELRTELEKAGHRFATASDTEVILAAYREWGEACLERLNGMFALVLYDGRDGPDRASLLLARDRAGKKPLYFAVDGGRFEFASELKAITLGRGLSLEALDHYLACGYVPGERCIVEGVRKLAPAHAARLILATLDLRVWRWWALPENRAEASADPTMLVEEAEHLLADSVRLRLVSDVPLGVLLSGGLDSSLIVAAAARQSGRPIKTFTITLPGSGLDESQHARRIASHFGTEHHELPLAEPMLDVLDNMAALVDEPLADSSSIPAYLVARLTRREVTVALGGDGGDELFGGYTQYASTLTDIERLDWVPGWALRVAGEAAARLPLGVRGRNRLVSLGHGPAEQLAWGSPYFDRVSRTRLLTAETLAARSTNSEAPEEWQLSLASDGRDAIDRMTRMHFRAVLPDDFLVKVDRTSMAHSLEARSPFLDYRLIEFAFGRIPSSLKVHAGEGRRLQLVLAARLLPPGHDLHRKQGFSVPLDEWLRRADCAPVRALVPALTRWLRRDLMDALIRGQMRGRTNGSRLYALIMLGHALRNLRLA